MNSVEFSYLKLVLTSKRRQSQSAFEIRRGKKKSHIHITFIPASKQLRLKDIISLPLSSPIPLVDNCLVVYESNSEPYKEELQKSPER